MKGLSGAAAKVVKTKHKGKVRDVKRNSKDEGDTRGREKEGNIYEVRVYHYLFRRR